MWISSDRIAESIFKRFVQKNFFIRQINFLLYPKTLKVSFIKIIKLEHIDQSLLCNKVLVTFIQTLYSLSQFSNFFTTINGLLKRRTTFRSDHIFQSRPSDLRFRFYFHSHFFYFTLLLPFFWFYYIYFNKCQLQTNPQIWTVPYDIITYNYRENTEQFLPQ